MRKAPLEELLFFQFVNHFFILQTIPGRPSSSLQLNPPRGLPQGGFCLKRQCCAAPHKDEYRFPVPSLTPPQATGSAFAIAVQFMRISVGRLGEAGMD